MEWRENEPLSRHTTLRVGGPARYFAVARSETEIAEAAGWACRRQLPLFILGGGSNVLAADEGFPGVVIKMATTGMHCQSRADGLVEVVAEAGEDWDGLVARTVAEDWAGWENLSLIPGTLGGAVAGNIGAYGVEIQETLQWVEAMDLRTGRRRRLSHAECQFDYRHSWFKTPSGRTWVVLRAGFLLKKGGPVRLHYPDLQRAFPQGRATVTQVRKAVVAIRQAKLPDWQTTGTAGSFFKNLVLPATVYAELAARYPGLPGFVQTDGRVKVPLGYILDKVCGLRGWRRGAVGLHERQALVLINEGSTAAEIASLAREVAERVRAATGLEIEWEVEKLGPVRA